MGAFWDKDAMDCALVAVRRWWSGSKPELGLVRPNEMGVRQVVNYLAPSMSQAPLTDSHDPHSTVHIGSIQTHGTQLLLVSSNRLDSWHRNPGMHNAAQFQTAMYCVENKSFVFFSLASPV